MTEDGVESYLQLYAQTLQDKCKEMYRGKYLKSFRMAVQDSDTFIQGRVSAEMIKKCVYKVDIRLDRHHVVVECQCECAAGMGPEAHCKHIAPVFRYCGLPPGHLGFAGSHMLNKVCNCGE